MRRLVLVLFVLASVSLQAQNYTTHSIEGILSSGLHSYTESSSILATNRMSDGIPLSFGINYLYSPNSRWQLGAGFLYNLPTSLDHAYINSKLTADGNKMYEAMKISYFNTSVLARRLFPGNHFTPYMDFKIGYNLPPSVTDYSFEFTKGDGSIVKGESKIEKQTGGLSLALGFGSYIGKRFRVGFAYGLDRYGANIFVDTEKFSNFTTQPTHDELVVKYRYKDLACNFSVAYLFGFGKTKSSEIGECDNEFNKGFRVKIGTSYSDFVSKYENYNNNGVTTMWSKQKNAFHPQSPTFNIAAEYLFALKPKLSIGAGVRYDTPTKYRWENRVLNTGGANIVHDMFWETFVLSILKPYVIVQYNFDAKMSPYIRIVAGHSFNFTSKEEKYGDIDKDRTFSWTGNYDGPNGGFSIGFALTKRVGLELGVDNSYVYTGRNYTGLNKLGTISNQKDQNEGWLMGTSISAFYKF